MLESGENQWIPAMIVIVVYLVAIFSLIYGHQYIVRIWKNFLNRHHSSSPPSTLARNNTESPTFAIHTEPIPSIQRHRFHSIDAFRG